MTRTRTLADKVTLETTKRGFSIFHISNGSNIRFDREQRILVKEDDLTWVFEEQEWKNSDEVGSRIIIPGEIEAIVTDRYFDCNDRDECHILKVRNGEVIETIVSNSGLASETDDSVRTGFYQNIFRLALEGWVDVPVSSEEGV